MKIIAVDIGGTFTDVIISDTNKNKIYEIKTLTTTNDPFIGLNNALIEANLKYEFLDLKLHHHQQFFFLASKF